MLSTILAEDPYFLTQARGQGGERGGGFERNVLAGLSQSTSLSLAIAPLSL